MDAIVCNVCMVELTTANAGDMDSEGTVSLREQMCSECEYEALEEIGNARMRGRTKERLRRAV